MPFIITISEIPEVHSDQPVEHYRRRVDVPDIQLAIRAIDGALAIKPRRIRSDKGKARTEAPAQ